MTKTYELKRKYKYVVCLYEEYDDAELLGFNEEDGTGWIKYDKGTRQTITRLEFLHEIKTPEKLYEEEKMKFIGDVLLQYGRTPAECSKVAISFVCTTAGLIFDKIKSGELVIKLDM